MSQYITTILRPLLVRYVNNMLNICEISFVTNIIITNPALLAPTSKEVFHYILERGWTCELSHCLINIWQRKERQIWAWLSSSIRTRFTVVRRMGLTNTAVGTLNVLRLQLEGVTPSKNCDWSSTYALCIRAIRQSPIRASSIRYLNVWSLNYSVYCRWPCYCVLLRARVRTL